MSSTRVLHLSEDPGWYSFACGHRRIRCLAKPDPKSARGHTFEVDTRTIVFPGDKRIPDASYTYRRALWELCADLPSWVTRDLLLPDREPPAPNLVRRNYPEIDPTWPDPTKWRNNQGYVDRFSNLIQERPWVTTQTRGTWKQDWGQPDANCKECKAKGARAACFDRNGVDAEEEQRMRKVQREQRNRRAYGPMELK